MAFVSASALGAHIEGTLSLKNGGVSFVEDEDGKALDLAEIAAQWDGKKVRISIVDLDLLEGLVEAGMTPGSEQQFLETLSDEQVDALLAPPPSGDKT